MSTKGMLEVRIANHKLQEKQIEEEVKKYVQDKSEPLEDRWKIFVDSDLGENSSWSEEFEGVSSDDYYDKYYIEKYQTVRVTRLLDQATQKPYNGKKPADLDTPEKVAAFKEDVLSQFIRSFKYDW